MKNPFLFILEKIGQTLAIVSEPEYVTVQRVRVLYTSGFAQDFGDEYAELRLLKSGEAFILQGLKFREPQLVILYKSQIASISITPLETLSNL